MTFYSEGMEMPPQPASSEDEKKADAYHAGVHSVEVIDAESGRRKDTIYDNIPEGVDPRFVQEERVVRGLSQRHIQVSEHATGCNAR
jgi:hypothetical protein